jgi:hypothetical protein
MIAYSSNEAGGSGDVYVRPFPGPGGPWRISTQGGLFPRWSGTARELLFLDPSKNTLMFSPYNVVGNSFRADKPQVWSPQSIQRLNFSSSNYDLHPDGKRVAVSTAKAEGNSADDKVVFVSNFFEYLQKLAPARK